MNGRDKNGRFASGNGGGPGRPPKAREERYWEIARGSVSFKDWRAIWKKAAEQAKAGDATARKFLADYLIGSPTQSHDIKNTGEVTIKVVYGTDGQPKKP